MGRSKTQKAKSKFRQSIMIPERRFPQWTGLRRGSLFCHRREREDGSQLTLTVLEVIEDNVQTLAVGAKVFDDDTAAAYDLAGISLTIDFAETSPGAQNLRVTDFDEVDLVLGAESLDELDVFGLGTGLYQDAKVSLALVQGFGALPETASETIVNECVLQDLLDRNSVSASVDSRMECT